MCQRMAGSHRRGRRNRLAGPLAMALLVATAVTASGGSLDLISQPDPAGFSSVGPSSVGDLSADGRFVVFTSPAVGFVAGQNDRPIGVDTLFGRGSWDVFLRDRLTGRTSLVSHASTSLTTGGLIGNDVDNSLNPVISADGRYLAYVSARHDLVYGQTGSGNNSVYLFDRLLSLSTLVSHRFDSPRAASFGGISAGPVISTDGRFVAYVSNASDVVPGQGWDSDQKLFVYDRLTDTNRFVEKAGQWVRMSADGRFIVYYKDYQIYLYDRVADATTLVSHAAGAANGANNQSAFPEISADGSVIVYSSWSTDLVSSQIDSPTTNDLFLYARESGETALLSHSSASPAKAANNESWEPSLSADGRWIAFYSTATDLVPGVNDANNTYDVFLYDRLAGATALVSHASGSPSATANQRSLFAVLSADGARMAFTSSATNLVAGQPDSSPWSSLFVYDRGTGASTLVGTMSRPGLPDPAYLKTHPRISAAGNAVTFGSYSALTPEDASSDWDVYLNDTGAPGDPGPFAPCAILDTRDPEQGPALRSNVRRVLSVAGTCGVPATARSVSVDVAVLASTNKGSLRLTPGVKAATAVVLGFQKGETRTASFTLPLATNGAGTLAILPNVAGKGTVHAVVAITGYSE